MGRELFRREVLDRKQAELMGGISLAQPISLRVLSVAAVIVALLGVLYLSFGSYTRRSRVTGQLVPSNGLATVLAPATGVVSHVRVMESEKVKKGQVLAIVTVQSATLANGDTASALDQRIRRRQQGLESARVAQEQQLSAQVAGLEAQIQAAQDELRTIDTEISTRRDQVRIANETLGRLRQLQVGKYVSLLQIKQQESVALGQISAMQNLQRQADGIRRTIAQLNQAFREIPGRRKGIEADYMRQMAELEQERVETDARGALAIIAPISGIVATRSAKAGQSVHEGQPLLSLLPGDGKLEAELLLPSRAIGFIEPGDLVLLRYQAYPYQKFGHQKGRVTRISRSALQPEEISMLNGAGSGSEPFYRVTVALSRQTVTAYGKHELLKPGMLFDADVMGEQRRLIEWVLEPLYSLSGRLAG